ncbi:MAG: tetratricopeptide repeat protein [Lachnospiraceae bacterium]|nr:tetratricopeptide repeat protein [Lachnospiraceae bacterium]
MSAGIPAKKRFWLAAFLLLFAGGCGFSTGKQEYKDGVAAYERGAYREAAGYFAEAIEENEDRAEYYLYYGFTLIELASYDASVENFTKVILPKDFTSVQENNKRAYRGMGIAYYLAGNEEEALENFYAALQVPLLDEMDGDIRSYLLQVNASLLERYRTDGELERARQMCDELLASYGETADIFRMRADLWMEEENYAAALEDFDAAIAAGDSRMSTLLGKMMALKALGREDEVRLVSSKIAAMEPGNDEEAFAGALAAYSIGDYDTAKPLLERLALSGMLRANYYLAQIGIMQKNYPQAVRYLRALEDAGAQDAELYYQMAVCLVEEGQYAEAEKYYGKLSELNDQSYARRQEKLYIVLLEKQGRYVQALERMEKYREDYITPQDGEYEEAQKEYEFLKRIQSE